MFQNILFVYFGYCCYMHHMLPWHALVITDDIILYSFVFEFEKIALFKPLIPPNHPTLCVHGTTQLHVFVR